MSDVHEPRLLIYSQDGLGLGHQRRTTLLADGFLRSCPGASALTVSDSPLGKFFPSSSPGHDYCKLPSVRKVGPGDWTPVSLSSSFTDVLEMRRAMLQTTVLAFRPDVLLVDHMPHGAMGELVPTLEALRNEPTVVVLGLRDILDAPAVIRERWRLEGAYEAVDRYYDQVFVYGSADVFDVATQYEWPTGASSKIRYCGYVCAPPPDVSESVRSRYPGTSDGGRFIVAMAGGGADAYPLFDALLAAMPQIQESGPCHLVLITGPFLPAARRAELAARAQGLPVEVVTSVPDPVCHAASADLVVAMAGYNTTVEILSVGTPALLVPRPGPSAEQQMRARLFAERGWVDWLPPQELTAEALGAAVGVALRRPRRTASVRPPDLTGRVVASARLVASLSRSYEMVPAGSPADDLTRDDTAPDDMARVGMVPTAAGPARLVRDDDDYLLA